jgi:hypothetical protein
MSRVNIPKSVKDTVLKRYKNKCGNPACPSFTHNGLELHHIYSYAEHEWWRTSSFNLIPLCNHCHRNTTKYGENDELYKRYKMAWKLVEDKEEDGEKTTFKKELKFVEKTIEEYTNKFKKSDLLSFLLSKLGNGYMVTPEDSVWIKEVSQHWDKKKNNKSILKAFNDALDNHEQSYECYSTGCMGCCDAYELGIDAGIFDSSLKIHDKKRS